MPRACTWGRQRVQTFSVKRFPDRAGFGLAARYLGDPASGTRGVRHNALITLTLSFPDPEKTRVALTTASQWAAHQTTGNLAHYAPRVAQAKRDYDGLFVRLDNGDRPLRAYLGVVLLTPEEEAAAAGSNLRTYWRELGFQIMPDHFFALPLFLNCLPFGADRGAIAKSYRYRTLSASHAVVLMPVFADWKGTGTPVLNLVGRSGQLMDFCLFDSATNYNAVVAASSGSGKSFLANEIIATTLAIGGRCWVIDVGRSYAKLCDSLGGQFVEFTRDAAMVLNPFALIHDWEEEADVIAALVTAMAAPTEPLGDFRTAGLEARPQGPLGQPGHRHDGRCRRRGLGRGRRSAPAGCGPPALSLHLRGRVRALLHRGEHHRLRCPPGRAGARGAEGPQAPPAGHPAAADLPGPAGDVPGRARHVQKVVLIDEAWDLLTQGDVAKFIETGYRRFRKYNGSAMTVTQSLADLYTNPTGRAIAQNSAHTLLLAQPSHGIEQLKGEHRLPLTDAGAELLKTVHTLPGCYSEIMVIGDQGAGIGRLIVDPFRQLLYSTKPADVAAIGQWRAQGLTVVEAIDRLLEAQVRDAA